MSILRVFVSLQFFVAAWTATVPPATAPGVFNFTSLMEMIVSVSSVTEAPSNVSGITPESSCQVRKIAECLGFAAPKLYDALLSVHRMDTRLHICGIADHFNSCATPYKTQCHFFDTLAFNVFTEIVGYLCTVQGYEDYVSLVPCISSEVVASEIKRCADQFQSTLLVDDMCTFPENYTNCVLYATRGRCEGAFANTLRQTLKTILYPLEITICQNKSLAADKPEDIVPVNGTSKVPGLSEIVTGMFETPPSVLRLPSSMEPSVEDMFAVTPTEVVMSIVTSTEALLSVVATPTEVLSVVTSTQAYPEDASTRTPDPVTSQSLSLAASTVVTPETEISILPPGVPETLVLTPEIIAALIAVDESASQIESTSSFTSAATDLTPSETYLGEPLLTVTGTMTLPEIVSTATPEIISRPFASAVTSELIPSEITSELLSSVSTIKLLQSGVTSELPSEVISELSSSAVNSELLLPAITSELFSHTVTSEALSSAITSNTLPSETPSVAFTSESTSAQFLTTTFDIKASQVLPNEVSTPSAVLQESHGHLFSTLTPEEENLVEPLKNSPSIDVAGEIQSPDTPDVSITLIPAQILSTHAADISAVESSTNDVLTATLGLSTSAIDVSEFGNDVSFSVMETPTIILDVPPSITEIPTIVLDVSPSITEMPTLAVSVSPSIIEIPTIALDESTFRSEIPTKALDVSASETQTPIIEQGGTGSTSEISATHLGLPASISEGLTIDQHSTTTTIEISRLGQDVLRPSVTKIPTIAPGFTPASTRIISVGTANIDNLTRVLTESISIEYTRLVTETPTTISEVSPSSISLEASPVMTVSKVSVSATLSPPSMKAVSDVSDSFTSSEASSTTVSDTAVSSTHLEASTTAATSEVSVSSVSLESTPTAAVIDGLISYSSTGASPTTAVSDVSVSPTTVENSASSSEKFHISSASGESLNTSHSTGPPTHGIFSLEVTTTTHVPRVTPTTTTQAVETSSTTLEGLSTTTRTTTATTAEEVTRPETSAREITTTHLNSTAPTRDFVASPLECYECHSGAPGSWQNMNCQPDGTITDWAAAPNVCHGPCVSVVTSHPKGEVYRACSKNYYFPFPTPLDGCITHNSDLLCFCATDLCNQRNMLKEQEEFVNGN